MANTDKELLIQLSTRIPYALERKLNEYIAFMRLPIDLRPAKTAEWPKTKQALVIAALEQFLPDYPLTKKPGPRKKPRRRKAPQAGVRDA